MLLNQMAGVSGLFLANGSVAHVQPRGQWLVFSLGGGGGGGGSGACVQPGGSVGAYMWMLDGWELYVYENFHVKSEMMFIGKQIETCCADESRRCLLRNLCEYAQQCM